MLKEQKGITLIALVITIIVLLILAGVAIATLAGDNGILTKASNSKSETIKSQLKEDMALAISEIMANKEDPTYTGTQNIINNTNVAAIMNKNDNSFDFSTGGSTPGQFSVTATTKDGKSEYNIIYKFAIGDSSAEIKVEKTK